MSDLDFTDGFGGEGPPSPFTDGSGGEGPAAPTASELEAAAHIDFTSGEGPADGPVDYSSLFTAAVKTAGDVTKAAITGGLPAPVAASAAAAAAARQAAVNATPPAGGSKVLVAPTLGRDPPAPTSTAAVVAIGLGLAAGLGLFTLAVTRKARR